MQTSRSPGLLVLLTILIPVTAGILLLGGIAFYRSVAVTHQAQISSISDGLGSAFGVALLVFGLLLVLLDTYVYKRWRRSG